MLKRQRLKQYDSPSKSETMISKYERIRRYDLQTMVIHSKSSCSSRVEKISMPHSEYPRSKNLYISYLMYIGMTEMNHNGNEMLFPSHFTLKNNFLYETQDSLKREKTRENNWNWKVYVCKNCKTPSPLG